MSREDSEDFSRLVEYREGLRAGARRYDMGEPSNFALMPMVSEALRQIQDWTVPVIQRELADYCGAIVAAVEPLGFRAVAEGRRAGHYLGLRHPEGISAGLGGRLAAQGIFVSLRRPSLRITPHWYNDATDRERLVGALGRLSCLR